MKFLIASVLIAIPTLAMAQNSISDNILHEQNNSCVAKCTETRSYAFCAETCGCMAGEMKRHWTAEDFQARSMTLSKHSNDRSVRDELDRMARYCAKRGRMTAQE